MADDAITRANKQAREERKKAHLQEMFRHHTEQLRALENRDAPSVAREIHINIDGVLARDRNRSTASSEIRCRAGCAHCCHEPVEIWPHEAALLIATARDAGVELDYARLQRQSQFGIDDWRQQLARDRACVFLGDDGRCKVYEVRPNACRKLLVLTDPSLCDADRHPPDSVERWFSLEAEILESAALEVYGAALLPRSLLTALNERDDADVQ